MGRGRLTQDDERRCRSARHIDPRLLQFLETLDDVSHGAAKVLSKLLMRRIRLPEFVEVRDGKRPKLLAHRAIHKLRRRGVEETVQPCPAIYAILDLLLERGVPMGLVSNGIGKGYGHDVLAAFDLAKYFEVTIFREDVGRPKPHPDSLIRALHGIGRAMPPDDVIWYVGDQRKDIAAALRASSVVGVPITPIACGVKAALGIVECGLSHEQIMVTLQDLEMAILQLFDEAPDAVEPPSWGGPIGRLNQGGYQCPTSAEA